MKQCTKCGDSKPFSEFCKGRHTHGLAHHCKSCQAQTMRDWRARNPERAKASDLRWASENREKRRESCERWRSANLEYNAARAREWRKKNPEKARANDAAKSRRVRATPDGVLAYRVGNRIRNALRSNERRQGGQTFKLLGYTPAELRVHLERQFLPGMGWHNIGQWHIDHIVPLSSFSIHGKEDPELVRAWSLTNLRPLWAVDNIRKGAKRVTLL